MAKHYWRPSVAVDVALLTVVADGLAVLLHRESRGPAKGTWVLPGTFLHEGELLVDAALRVLAEKVGVQGSAPQQLRVFDGLTRDLRTRVLSAAHVDLVPAARLAGTTGVVAPLVGAVPEVEGPALTAYDHADILAAAVVRVREAHERTADPFGVLGDEFTMADLRALHSAVREAPGPIPKDTFRRHVEGLVVGTGRFTTGGVGRPAELLRRT